LLNSELRYQGEKVIRTGECAWCHGQEGRALKGRVPDCTPVGNNHVPGQLKGPTKSTYRWLRMTLCPNEQSTGTNNKTSNTFIRGST